MQLRYRGTTYQATHSRVNTVEFSFTGRFLGQTYTLRQTHIQTPMKSDLYKYRGVIYQK